MVKLLVDDQEITAPAGQSLLQACLQNNIYIPNLCFLESDAHPAASCRLCFVQIEGQQAPVTACTVPVDQGLRVKTDTAAVRRLQRSALRLLLSVHHVDCKHCHAHRACDLQKIAKVLKIGLKAKPLPTVPRPVEVDRSHPYIEYYPHRCVLCGKCIKVCRNRNHQSAFTFSGRGIDTRVSHYPLENDGMTDCADCDQCVSICPVGALQKTAVSEKRTNDAIT